jgi:hypothetical protein
MPLQETIILFKQGFVLFYYRLAALQATGDTDGAILLALQPAFTTEKDQQTCGNGHHQQ